VCVGTAPPHLVEGSVSVVGSRPDIGIGQRGFVERYGLHTDEQRESAAAVDEMIDVHDLRTIRVVVVDQHGVPRTKWLTADAFRSALHNGVDFSGAIYSLDTANAVFTPAFAAGGGFGIPEFTGFPDLVVVPDPATFRVLPWADRSAWVLCDPYFASGAPVPLDARHLLRRQLSAARELGYDYLTGLEVEFYIVGRGAGPIDTTQMPARAPDVTSIEPGYQFLGEYRQAQLEPLLSALRDALLDVGLPLRTIENEWGPGQIEMSFGPLTGIGSADAMVLLRAVAKEICHSRGLLASFMCWPALPNFFPSGWHLHQSLLDGAGVNAFAADDDPLSSVGRAYAAGLLEHARAMTLLGTPTINGLRRFRPYSFAPDRVSWGLENRGTLVRVQGSPGDSSSHLELRTGEPAANPYLYLASSLAAGLDGIRNDLKPPPMVEADPYAVDTVALPHTMDEAVTAFEASDFLRRELGEPLTRYLSMMKRSELGRFTEAVGEPGEAVTSWEMDEYFETY
jgi:glutamine synthetase